MISIVTLCSFILGTFYKIRNMPKESNSWKRVFQAKDLEAFRSKTSANFTNASVHASGLKIKPQANGTIAEVNLSFMPDAKAF